MGMGFSFGFLMMILAGGGGGGELLDYIDTQVYWQQQGVADLSVDTMAAQLQAEQAPPEKIDEKQVARLIDQLGSADFDRREDASAKLAAMGPPVIPYLKKASESDDAEIALRAEALIGKIKGVGEGGDPTRVRRLMAIRTLGELGDEQAVAVLTPLLESKRPFEAEYARRALAAISGATIEPAPVKREALDADVALLPANVGVVAQQSGFSDRRQSLETMLADVALPEQMGVSREQIKQQVTEAVAQAGAMVGNLRLDAVTLGVAEKMTNNDGFVIVIARGKYDHEAVAALLKDNSRRVHEFGDVKAYSPEGDMAMIPLDAERMILVVGEDESIPAGLMAEAIAAGKGTLHENEAMSKLIAGVDRSGQMWAVSRLDDSYKQAPFMMPFQTATLTGKRTASGTTKLSLHAVGDDAEQVATAVEAIKGLVKQGIEELKQVAETPIGSMVTGYLTALEGMTIEQDEATMTIEMEMPGDPARTMLMPFFGVRAVGHAEVQRAHAAEAKAAAAEAQAAQR